VKFVATKKGTTAEFIFSLLFIVVGFGIRDPGSSIRDGKKYGSVCYLLRQRVFSISSYADELEYIGVFLVVIGNDWLPQVIFRKILPEPWPSVLEFSHLYSASNQEGASHVIYLSFKMSDDESDEEGESLNLTSFLFGNIRR